MFCPKCAAQNLDGASFCRVCGANISLVPQALNGHMPQTIPAEDLTRSEKRAMRKAPTLDNAFRNAFMGIAFLLVTIALSLSDIGRGWWFWMIIPAFSLMGTGIAQYMRYREHQNRSLPGFATASPQLHAAAPAPIFPARSTGDLMASPPSVTEGTTRHLGVEAPTKVLNNESSK